MNSCPHLNFRDKNSLRINKHHWIVIHYCLAPRLRWMWFYFTVLLDHCFLQTVICEDHPEVSTHWQSNLQFTLRKRLPAHIPGFSILCMFDIIQRSTLNPENYLFFLPLKKPLQEKYQRNLWYLFWIYWFILWALKAPGNKWTTQGDHKSQNYRCRNRFLVRWWLSETGKVKDVI